MTRIGLLICLTAYFPVTANAETYATITKITPNYTYSKSYKKEKSCFTVDTPIYGNTTSRGTAGGDVFTGMLLGSLLGKGATGKDKGAVVGAVLGGIIAADKSNTKTSVIGYEPVRNCEIVQIPETIKTIKNCHGQEFPNGLLLRKILWQMLPEKLEGRSLRSLGEEDEKVE